MENINLNHYILGILDDEAYLCISGRLKRFVKVRGEMISLSAIENAKVESASLRCETGWTVVDVSLKLFSTFQD